MADLEMQCCGDRSAVAGHGGWPLSLAGGRGWLTELFGTDERTGTSLHDHHSSDDVPEANVTVARIEAVFCPHERHGRVLTPVAGSATRETRTTAAGWQPEAGPVRFVGYLVDVERA